MDWSFMFFRYYNVMLWIWFLLVFTFFGVSGVIVWIFRYSIQARYWEFRWPEKVVKVIIHYPNRSYTEHVRLIPEKDTFNILDKEYLWSEENVISASDQFQTGLKLVVNGIDYEYDTTKLITKKRSRHPQIHYFYNNPDPIMYDTTQHKIRTTAKELGEFHENQLVAQFLMVEEVTKLVMIMLIALGIIGIIMVAALYGIGLLNGWWKR